jgi:hypothetical protein
MSEQDLTRLLENISDSLQNEMHTLRNEMRSGFAEIRTEMRSGFDRVEARLGRHGGLIQGGARQITRLVEWSEHVDELLAERDRTIEDLKRRVEKLEAQRNGGKA